MFNLATCMYYTGLDPFTKQEVYIAKGFRDRGEEEAGERLGLNIIRWRKCVTITSGSRHRANAIRLLDCSSDCGRLVDYRDTWHRRSSLCETILT